MTTSLLLVAGLAVVVYMLTQFTKTVIDITMGRVDVDGKQVRKRKADPKKYAWLNRLVLPALPPVLGCLLGAFVPFRPEALVEYVNEFVDGVFWGTVTYAFYGAIVGNFADTIYTKVKRAVNDYKKPKKDADD